MENQTDSVPTTPTRGRPRKNSKKPVGASRRKSNPQKAQSKPAASIADDNMDQSDVEEQDPAGANSADFTGVPAVLSVPSTDLPSNDPPPQFPAVNLPSTSQNLQLQANDSSVTAGSTCGSVTSKQRRPEDDPCFAFEKELIGRFETLVYERIKRMKEHTTKVEEVKAIRVKTDLLEKTITATNDKIQKVEKEMNELRDASFASLPERTLESFDPIKYSQSLKNGRFFETCQAYEKKKEEYDRLKEQKEAEAGELAELTNKLDESLPIVEAMRKEVHEDQVDRKIITMEYWIAGGWETKKWAELPEAVVNVFKKRCMAEEGSGEPETKRQRSGTEGGKDAVKEEKPSTI